MVLAKLRVRLLQTRGSRDKKSVPFAVHELSRKAKRDEHTDYLEDKLQANMHSLEKSIEDTRSNRSVNQMASTL